MASAALCPASLKGYFRGAAKESMPAEQKYKSGERIVKKDCESHCAEEQGGQKPYVKTYLLAIDGTYGG
jgi:hypothetical protein